MAKRRYVLGCFIANAGHVVGYYIANDKDHGFVLSDGQYTTIDVPGAADTAALGINDAGQIVGEYTGGHGFLLSNGNYTQLDMAGATSTTARAINNAAQIVGSYNANNQVHAFLLSGGQYTTLDDPNAGTGAFQGTLAYGINDAGKVVGFYYDANNVVHGFLASPVHANAALGASNNLSVASTSGATHGGSGIG